MGPTNMLVKDRMSTALRTLDRNDELAVADDLMKQERIRHLPVLDENGDLCGIVSQRDLFRGALLRALGYGSHAEDMMLHKIRVKEIMTEDPYTVSADTPLQAAAKVMLEHKIGCLPVVDGTTLVGLLTESDLIAVVAEGD